MNNLAISLPIISAVGSFILIFTLRLLDVFEREPIKYIFLNFVFGVIAYLISALFVSYLFELSGIHTSLVNLSKKTIYFSVIFSSLIMFSSQSIIGLISENIFKRQYDTITDYLIYFSSVGIGFSFSEVFFHNLLNKTNNESLLAISKNLYYSSFFTGTTLPFLMAGFGAGIYLLKISKKNSSSIIFNISLLTIFFSIFIQLLFYSMNYFILVSIPSNHTPSDFLNLIKELKFFSNSLSELLLVSCTGFAVLYDNYIITKFAILVEKNFKKQIDILPFMNPFSYIFSIKINQILKVNLNYNYLDKDFQKFSILALKNFNDKKNSSIYINEAIAIIDK